MNEHHAVDRPPPVTVAVINYNGRNVIGDTLRSVLDSDYPDIEAIVVDDESSDGSLDFVKEAFPGVKLFRQPRNRGLNAARNRALAVAAHDLTLLSDNDMIMAPDCLGRLVEAMTADPNAAVATPMILDADDREKIYSDNVELHYLCLGIIRRRHQPVPPDLDWTARRMVVGSGGMLLVRRSLLKNVGGFDEDFRFGYDEGEFALRVSMAGLSVMYAPRAKIYHVESAARSRHMLRYAIANRWRLMLTHYAARTLLLTAPALIAFEAAQLLFLALKGGAGEWFRALGWIIRDGRRIMDKRRAAMAIKVTPDRDLLTSGEIFVFSYRLGSRMFTLAKRAAELFFNGYWALVRPLLTK